MQRVVRAGLGLAALLVAAAQIGCNGESTAPVPKPASTSLVGVRVSVTVLAGLVAESIDDRRGEWEGRTGARVTVRKLSVDAFRASVGRKQADVDVLVYPVGWLSLVAQGVGAKPLPDWMVGARAAQVARSGEAARDPAARRLGRAFLWPDIFEVYRTRLVCWGPKPVAVPLGGDCLLCYYRRDWLEDETHRDAFRAKFGRTLRPPETWQDYIDIAAYFHDPDGTPARVGLVEPWGDAVLRRLCWLAHVAPYAKHADDFSLLFRLGTLKPRVAGEGFIEGTLQMRRAAALGPADMGRLDLAGAAERFLAGGAALCLAGGDLPSVAGKHAAALETVGVCVLPGSRRTASPATGRLRRQSQTNRVAVLGHRAVLASVTEASAVPDAAFRFLAFLAGPEASLAEVTHPQSRLGPFRLQHTSDPVAWTDAGLPKAFADAYVDAVARASEMRNVVLPLRVPGAEGYLADLDRMLDAALVGSKPVRPLLEALAADWEKRTGQLGRPKQIAAFRRSLGLRDLSRPKW